MYDEYENEQEPIFNGDISGWDVSSVTNISDIFKHSKFHGDISGWDVSNVTNMIWMFSESQFIGDISECDASKANMG